MDLEVHRMCDEFEIEGRPNRGFHLIMVLKGPYLVADFPRNKSSTTQKNGADGFGHGQYPSLVPRYLQLTASYCAQQQKGVGGGNETTKTTNIERAKSQL